MQVTFFIRKKHLVQLMRPVFPLQVNHLCQPLLQPSAFNCLYISFTPVLSAINEKKKNVLKTFCPVSANRELL